MPSLPIRWILARAHCQATEDEGRVAQALDAAVSGGAGTRELFTGQSGNLVTVLAKRVQSSGEVRSTWDRWVQAGIVKALADEVDARVDEEGILHLRLDKQAAYDGRLSLLRGADVIDVQVKLKAYPANPEEIHRVARALTTEAV